MGSRAITLVTRDTARLGAPKGWLGIVHTRTGRRFFAPEDEVSFLTRLQTAIDRAGLWNELDTDWLLFDGEILPWSLKSGAKIRDQYAAVAASANAVLPEAVATLEQAASSGLDVAALLHRTASRRRNAERYTAAYRRYVGRTNGIEGTQLAPFQVLAAEGRTFADRDHDWHLAVADRLVEADPDLIRRTNRIHIDLTDTASIAAATGWWTTLTDAGGEGMVVKPRASLARTERGLAQPGIKVRDR